jgi:GNAT superfamily N-acetyltransferase
MKETLRWRSRNEAPVSDGYRLCVDINHKKGNELRRLLAECFPEVMFDSAYPLARQSFVLCAYTTCGLLVGTASGRISGDVASLNWVAVTPGYRGNKLAYWLCNAVVSILWRMGYSQVDVTMNPVTPEAKRMYEKMGFEEIR